MTTADSASTEGLSLRELLEELADPLEQIDRGPIPDAYVVAVIVVHDGARWVRGCLNAVSGQTRPADVVVLVDTGSVDASADYAATALELGGVDVLVTRPRTEGFGAAVAAGLSAARELPSGAGPSWVWLLHDDCAPAPTALEELIRAGPSNPGAGVFGPKVVDWTDPKALIEVGLTVDRAGHRVTGLEPRERDQGQFDSPRTVLAVGSAGALISQAAWDAVGGFDPSLPMFRDDIDFCWQAAAKGFRTEVVPAAVVRHARAASAGRRSLDVVEGPPRRVDRRHALQVLLANSGALGLILRVPILLVSSLLRATGDLITRRPQHALDELGALWHVLRSLPALVPATIVRDRTRKVSAREVRRLLSPRGSSLRSRLGQAGDLLAAGVEEARPQGGLETGPGEDDLGVEDSTDDARRIVRAVVRPSLLMPLALLVITLISARELLGAGSLAGGRLLPVPAGASDLWHSWWSTWTSGPSGGSPTPAPPWTPVLAALSSLTLGRPSLAVDLVLFASPAMAGLSVWHASRYLVRGRALRVWGASTWALSPLATGVVAAGRFDVAVALVTLPWLCSTGARMLFEQRRPWSVGLIFALTVIFVPQLWFVVIVLAGGTVVLGVRREKLSLRSSLFSLLAVAIVPLLLVLPWLFEALRHPGLMVSGLGRIDGTGWLAASQVPSAHKWLLLIPGGPGMPSAILLVGIVAAAVAVLFRQDSRSRSLGAVMLGIALVGFIWILIVGSSGVRRADGLKLYPWPAAGIAIATLGIVAAVLVAGEDLRSRLVRQKFGPRTLATVVLSALCALTPILLAFSWMLRGTPADGPGAVDRRTVALLPPDIQADAAAAKDPGQRVLVLQRRLDGSLRYDLNRLSGPELGDEDRRIPSRSADLLSAAVRDLGAARGSDAAEVVATFGVHILVVPGRSRTPLTDALDSQPSLSRRDTPYDLSVWTVTVPTGRAVVLDPALAKAASKPASTDRGVGRGPSREALLKTPPVVLPAGENTVRGNVAEGPAGRLLVLAEAQNSGWKAVLAGQELTPARAWGWAQAWQLPAGAGPVVISRSERRHHGLVLLQVFAFVTACVLASPSVGTDDETLAEGVDEETDT